MSLDLLSNLIFVFGFPLINRLEEIQCHFLFRQLNHPMPLSTSILFFLSLPTHAYQQFRLLTHPNKVFTLVFSLSAHSLLSAIIVHSPVQYYFLLLLYFSLTPNHDYQPCRLFTHPIPLSCCVVSHPLTTMINNYRPLSQDCCGRFCVTPSRSVGGS